MKVPPNAKLEQVYGYLRQNNLYALLVADEFDQLFAFSSDPASGRGKAAMQTVAEFAALGSSAAGRVSPTLCGSASMLPALVSGKGRTSDTLRKEYPLSAHTPDMNRTKFESRCVSNEHLSRDAAATIMQHFFPGADDAQKRVFNFFCGINLRQLKKLTLGSGISAPHSYWELGSMDDDANLARALDTKLYDENRKIIEPVANARSDKELWRAVTGVDWVREIKGLEKTEQRSIWLDRKPDEASVVQHLADKGWFNSTGTLLYPTAPAFLLRRLIRCESPLHCVAKDAKALNVEALQEAVRSGGEDAGGAVLSAALTDFIRGMRS